jgi:hypothetical protein
LPGCHVFGFKIEVEVSLYGSYRGSAGLFKKETGKKTAKLKQDDVERRLSELTAELASGSSPSLVPGANSDLALSPTAKKVGKSDAGSVSISSSFNVWAFWLITIVSLVLSQTPGISWLFTPINQFTTMVHELGHAFVCILTGGHVTGLTIVGDGAGHGGLTYYRGGIQFFTAQAGYLGTAVFGCLLIFLGQYPRFSKLLLAAIGVAIGLCSLTLVGMNIFVTGFQGFFSLIWGGALAFALCWLARKLDSRSANLVVLFLAVQTALNSLSAVFLLVQVYFGVLQSNAWSDASIMEKITHIPAFFWGLLWFLMSCAMVGFTLWHTYGKRLFGRLAGPLLVEK